MKTITIFGGSGFIGRAITAQLAQDNNIIRIVTRHADTIRRHKVMGKPGKIVAITAHRLDETSISDAINGSDYVINCLGILYENRHQAFDRIHHQIPALVGRVATSLHIDRLIHISAIGADPAAESLYAASKGKGELALLAAFPSATILRPSVVFGPDDDFFNRFGRMMVMAPALPLIGGGQTCFQPVYVGDVAAAVQQCLHQSASKGGIYELGGPSVWTFEQILHFLLDITGQQRMLVNIPWPVATLLARLMTIMPRPTLTPDQITLLRQDNVVTHAMPGLQDLGIVPQAIETIMPHYLRHYRAI